LQSVTVKDSAGGALSQTTYGYNGHGRRTSVTDAHSGRTDSTFDALDRVISITALDPTNGQARQTTSYTYDALGRVTMTFPIARQGTPSAISGSDSLREISSCGQNTE
jgi:YD repeat-containing protein